MKTLPYIFLRRLFVALFCIFCFAYPIAVTASLPGATRPVTDLLVTSSS